MIIDMGNTKQIIVKHGSIMLDGVRHGAGIINCADLTGHHELVVDDGSDINFTQMSYNDYIMMIGGMDNTINDLTVELLETEYQLIVGEVL